MNEYRKEIIFLIAEYMDKVFKEWSFIKRISNWIFLEKVNYNNNIYSIEKKPYIETLFPSHEKYIKNWEIFPLIENCRFSTEYFLDKDDKIWNYETLWTYDTYALEKYAESVGYYFQIVHDVIWVLPNWKGLLDIEEWEWFLIPNTDISLLKQHQDKTLLININNTLRNITK